MPAKSFAAGSVSARTAAFKAIEMTRKGLSFTALRQLTRSLDISMSQLAGALRVPERTLARRIKGSRLTQDESAKALRLLGIISLAVEVFGDKAPARDWLKRPNTALDGTAPLSLMDTEFGARMVEDVLGRIAHGVYS